MHLAAVCLLLSAVAAAARRPNFVLLWVDDLGYGDVGAFGNDTLLTPNIDRLAASGIKLTQHLVPSPICTPSRAALLTGRHAVRSGMTSDGGNTGVMGIGPGGLPHNEVTVAEVLREAGYATAMIGKWHLGFGEGNNRLPIHHGFDYYWGMPITNVQACKAGGKNEFEHSTLFEFVLTRYPVKPVVLSLLALATAPLVLNGCSRCSTMSWTVLSLAVVFVAISYWYTGTMTLLNPRSCVLFENDEVIEQPVQLNYLTYRHTEHSKSFIDRSVLAEKPFFLYLSYSKVHTALFSMDSFKGHSKHHGEFGDNVEEMDWSVGEVLDHLESKGVLNDTFVYFASDNGPFREERNEGGSCGYPPVLAKTDLGPQSTAISPSPLKGAKGQTWECGIRVPGIVAYPNRFAPGQIVHAATSSMDVMPTILSLAGVGDQVKYTADLPPGSKAHPGTIDGRDMTNLFVPAGGDSKVAKLQGELHEFMMHYCGATVSAVRYGEFKAHFTTAAWENEELGDQFCVNNVICSCHGNTHDPPLLYNINEDPAELTPLDTQLPEHVATIEAIREARRLHQQSVVAVPSQTEIFPYSLSHFPCCGQQPGTLQHAWQVITSQCGC